MNCIGDGKLLCLMDKQSIQSLSLYGMPSFLSLSTGLSLPAKYKSGTCLGETPLLSTFDGRVSLLDFSYDGCFVRYTETTDSLTYQLHIPPYCHIYQFPEITVDHNNLPCVMLRIPVGTPTPDGTCSSKECRLMITIVGQGKFSNDGRAILLSPGRSALLFDASSPKEQPKHLAQSIRLLRAPVITESLFYQNARKRYQTPLTLNRNAEMMADILTCLTASTGGVLSGHGEMCCLLADLPLIGQALLHIGKTEEAAELACFLLSHRETRGYLPLYMSPTDRFSASEETENEKAHYPAICLFFLDLLDKAPDHEDASRLRRALVHLLSLSESAMIHGELGFSGLEYPIRRGKLPANRILYGNATATAAYLWLAQRLQQSPLPLSVPCTPDAQTVSAAKAHFSTDFDGHFIPRVDSVGRIGKMKLPKVLYGPCPACGEHPYIGWLSRASYGSYLCPGCLEKGKREWIDREKDIYALPGSYAATETLLYKAGIKTHAQWQDTIENCVRYALQTEEKPFFYDLALLTSVVKEAGAPIYSDLMDQLDQMIRDHRTPFSAPEAAAYLLASAPKKQLTFS
ncbi:MAG: hypothetical protein E7616_03565 [Ruminococcaceae bacterium]|nr:hypothetical protein [Oscillospiraceae bacterium]